MIGTMMKSDDDRDKDRDDDQPGPDCLISSSFLIELLPEARLVASPRGWLFGSPSLS
jgi:hypothetical protein